ncbi:hypothetical protein ABZV24_07950 [Streptomyces sp. NPDC005251]|uniref:hypothetical protein n=1 Tax=Streptomyces sp. NPDC005251 TaxID=3157166 RepID=UPI00339E7240
MAPEWDWESGEGLLRIDDPADWDAAYDRGESRLGTAVIGLAFNCTRSEASPRKVLGQAGDLATGVHIRGQ